jgi:hypothetical protein
MAVQAGSVVALRKVSAQFTSGISFMIDPPLFGKVEDGVGPFDVVWADGSKVAAISNTNDVLDEITTAGTSTLALIGKRVRVSGQNAALDVIVIDAYSRATVDMVLGQTQSGAWRELAAASVVEVP